MVRQTRVATPELGLTRESRLRGRGHLARAWSRLVRKKIAVVCMITLVLTYTAGIFAGFIAPHPYSEIDATAFRSPPSFQHWAGTDFAGRDVLTRVLWGVQNTVILTVVSVITGSLIIGVSLGLAAGYFGGWIDAIINRVGEIFASFPTFFLLVILAATLRPRMEEWVIALEAKYMFLAGLENTGMSDYLVIALALVSFSWFSMARVVRGQVLYLKATQFVESARAIGASTPRILVSHLLPNSISPIVILVSAGMGSMIGAEILLSWLGLGIQPPRPSLGRMLLDAGSLSALQNVPWLLLAPGTAALLMISSWTLLGDALNDVLNPRTR